MTAVYIGLIIAAVIMFLSLVPVRIVADFAYNSDTNELYIKFLFIKVRLYPPQREEEEAAHVDKPDVTDRETEGILNKIKKAKHIYTVLKGDIFKLLGYLLKKAITVEELNISSRFGTGDPMYTGMLCGAANAAVFGALGAADAKMKIKKFSVDIKPDFDKAIFSAGMYTVLYTRILYLHYSIIKALIILKKLKKTLKEVKENE